MSDLITEEYLARLARVHWEGAESGADLRRVTRLESVDSLAGSRAAHVATRTSRLHHDRRPREADPGRSRHRAPHGSLPRERRPSSATSCKRGGWRRMIRSLAVRRSASSVCERPSTSTGCCVPSDPCMTSRDASRALTHRVLSGGSSPCARPPSLCASAAITQTRVDVAGPALCKGRFGRVAIDQMLLSRNPPPRVHTPSCSTLSGDLPMAELSPGLLHAFIPSSGAVTCRGERVGLHECHRSHSVIPHLMPADRMTSETTPGKLLSTVRHRPDIVSEIVNIYAHGELN